MKAAGDIDLVCIPIGGVPPVDWQDRLDDDEHRRAAAFRFPRDAHRFVNAHLALRAALGERLSKPPARLRIIPGEFGKPRVASETNLEFNLSHSGDTAVIAFSQGMPLGVDVESWRDLDEIETLAMSIMTGDELATFQALPASRQNRALLDLWTRKEACLKAWGLGLQLEPGRVQVGFDPGADAVVTREGRPDLHLRSITDLGGAALAVASHAPIGCVQLRQTTQAQGWRSKQKPE